MRALEPTAAGPRRPGGLWQIAQPPPPALVVATPPAAPSSGAPSAREGAIMRDSQMEELLTELKLNSRRHRGRARSSSRAARARPARDQVHRDDMDYTLIDYKMVLWEERAYHFEGAPALKALPAPVSGLRFDPELVCRAHASSTSRRATW